MPQIKRTLCRKDASAEWRGYNKSGL